VGGLLLESLLDFAGGLLGRFLGGVAHHCVDDGVLAPQADPCRGQGGPGSWSPVVVRGGLAGWARVGGTFYEPVLVCFADYPMVAIETASGFPSR
jgi:hypothetical protein